jgi:hypothetical protein
MRQWPRKAIWAKIMTSGIIAFTKRSNALIPKVRAAILPIVAPPHLPRLGAVALLIDFRFYELRQVSQRLLPAEVTRL